MMKNWTPSEDKKLSALWTSGASTSEIAELIGKPSRSSVIARASRIGLGPHPSNSEKSLKKRKESYELRKVIHMKRLGKNTDFIAEKTGFSKKQVTDVLMDYYMKQKKANEKRRIAAEKRAQIDNGYVPTFPQKSKTPDVVRCLTGCGKLAYAIKGLCYEHAYVRLKCVHA